MFEHQPTHDQIERRVGERERCVKIVFDEADRVRAGLGAGFGEHSFGEVHRGDIRAVGREPERMSPGAATEVEHRESARVADRGAEERFFESLKRVAVGLVHRPPTDRTRRECLSLAT